MSPFSNDAPLKSLEEARRRLALPRHTFTGREDDGSHDVAFITQLDNAWRLAENGVVPMTEEIAHGKFARPLDSFYDRLRAATLPIGPPYPLLDAHEQLINFHTALEEEAPFMRGISLEALTRGPFGYAIPDLDVLEDIVAFSPGGIVEMGAGRGYWAALLANLGATINAFDIEPDPAKNDWLGTSTVAAFFGEPLAKHLDRQWFPVNTGTAGILKGRPTTETLLMIWPPIVPGVAGGILKAFGGNRIVYVGEPSELGCAEPEFFKILWKRWKLVDVVDHPRLPWSYDRTFFYERI